MFCTQEHNEALIMAEAEKQQALCMKETEKNALQEKLNNAQQVIQDMDVELEKMKRQSSSKQEKDRVSTKTYSICPACLRIFHTYEHTIIIIIIIIGIFILLSRESDEAMYELA